MDVRMLRVREAGCIVACCAGAHVQASCSGTAHPLWCADVPCHGCSLRPWLVRAAACPPKCERTWHPSNWRCTACTQLRADSTCINCSGRTLRDGEASGMEGADLFIQVERDAFACQTREDTLTKQKGANFDQWLNPRQISQRPILWEVCCDEYTRFKSTYEATHDSKPCFGVRRFEFDQDNWAPSRGSAKCTCFARQGVVIPFTTYTHTLKHTYHPRCQSRLWVLRNSDTVEAHVHRR